MCALRNVLGRSRNFYTSSSIWGHAVAQLVEALRYKPEGRGFDSRWYHWNFSLILSFWPHYGPGVDSASNRNEYQEYFLGVKAAGVRADNLTTIMCRLSWNLEASNSWNPQGLSRCVMGLLYLYLYLYHYLVYPNSLMPFHSMRALLMRFIVADNNKRT